MNKTTLGVVVAIILIAGGAGIVWQTRKKQPSTSTTSTKTQTTNSTQNSNSTQPIALVTVKPDAKLGGYLVDSKGMTLYMNLKDKNGVSACVDACAKTWPPLLNTKGVDLISVKGPIQDKLGSYLRTDGTLQIGYGPTLLYYYSGDKNPGDTNGSGLDGGNWQLVVVK